MKIAFINLAFGILVFFLTLIIFKETSVAYGTTIFFMVVLVYLKVQRIEDRLNRIHKQLKFRQHRNPQQK